MINVAAKQICLGQYQTGIHFDRQCRISMEGQYVHGITSENRQIVQARSWCGPNELFRLLGQSVTDALVISEDTLCITFPNGDSLSLINGTDQYESFVITSGQLAMVSWLRSIQKLFLATPSKAV